ncbi:amidohydrolase [Aceticella autotrophica]|uniref:Amidohydrolase n=1 Tax=Aceticella autotrophica TaxID=2755338 RepID=A0A975G9U1_9THEO|nr:amidohydrolase [Aceticella autotrophica]QSZ26934.1 amidohydrolase [Aceticella autotrophica]
MLNILSEAKKIEDEIINLRRKIHMYPELGFEETKTSELVYSYLKDIGLEVKRIAKTGVVGLLKGNGDRTIAIRADMDALPIQEENDIDYASKIPGKMHACGHDVHTAILLGTAKLLSNMKDELKGNVKFIFQPAEETTGGALPMIEEGVLKDPDVDGIIGLHVDPGIEAGEIGITYGKAYASSDMFDITVKGKSGHGAEPHKAVDAIVIAGNIINALQTVVSRNINPFEPVVITIGSIKGGNARNIIADKVDMSGIIRMFDETKRDETVSKIKHLAENIVEAMGGSIEFSWIQGYPCLINDEKMIEVVKSSASSILRDTNIKNIMPTLGVEDFAYFTKYVPGCYYRLGCGNKEKGIDKPIHSNKFNIDEKCILIGMAVHVMTAINFLNEVKSECKHERILKKLFNYSDSL